jgi:hypothetical protein
MQNGQKMKVKMMCKDKYRCTIWGVRGGDKYFRKDI